MKSAEDDNKQLSQLRGYRRTYDRAPLTHLMGRRYLIETGRERQRERERGGGGGVLAGFSWPVNFAVVNFVLNVSA